MSVTREKTRFPAVKRLKGGYGARGLRFGIIISEFNEFLTERLLDGALDALVRHGARERDIRVIYVPGAFEIPLALKKILAQKPDAVITLAVVIRGETKHFDQVVREAARGIRELSVKTEIPVILGMIAAGSAEQAVRRVGLKQANKGREWALAAVEMANLARRHLKKETRF
jgi:6,7-dimethyl-8-ribityllumazine synthase